MLQTFNKIGSYFQLWRVECCYILYVIMIGCPKDNFEIIFKIGILFHLWLAAFLVGRIYGTKY